MNDLSEHLPEAPPSSAPRRPIDLWFEIIVVASVAVVPDLVRSIQWISQDPAAAAARTLSFVSFAFSIVMRSFPAILVTIFVIARSDRRWNDYGIRPLRVIDPAFALIAAALAYGSYYLLWMASARIGGAWFSALAARGAGSAYKFLPPHGAEWALLVVMALINGFAEEVVMRGYLITALQRVTRSATTALIVTTALFAAYHLYQGMPGVINGVAVSIVFGLVFLTTRRLWIVALAHSTLDLVGFINVAIAASKSN